MALKVHIFSFAYKRGIPTDLGPDGGGFIFDCRVLPNPYWVEELRTYTGRDKPVRDFFAGHAAEVAAFMGPVEALVRNSIAAYAREGREWLSVGFDCTGGKHRSVFCAEALAASLRGCEGFAVELVHTARDGWGNR